MTNELVREQLQLHFGKEYNKTLLQTKKFCSTLLNKPWWGSNRKVLLNNEGGINGMRTNALMHVIESDNITIGLKDYGNYLRNEYGSGKNQEVPLQEWDIALDNILPLIGGEPPSSGPSGWKDPFGLSSFEGTHSLYHLVYAKTAKSQRITEKTFWEILHLTPLEQDFFETYASVKDIKETSTLLGISAKEGKRIWIRVHNRARRISQTQ